MVTCGYVGGGNAAACNLTFLLYSCLLLRYSLKGSSCAGSLMFASLRRS